MSEIKYVLITPARNEEAYIESTIQSVISQSLLPEKWVIVSDGSTDATEAIVSRYESSYPFIQLVTATGSGKPNFGSKVNAINEGYKHLQNLQYNFIGNLDADVSFDSNYFKILLEEFASSDQLGIAGGVICELVNGKYVAQNLSSNSVAGAVQLFRNQCYQDIGGYIPMKFGGIDAAAEIMARMHEWEVRTIPELRVLHPRRVSTGGKNILQTRFNQGITNHLLGYHPLFHIASCVYRFTDKPYFIGGFISIFGYFFALLKKDKKSIPQEAITFLRAEQLRRLKLSFLNRKRI